MTTTLVTAPTVEPITLQEAKHHLRETLVDTGNDAFIMGLIAAARAACEQRLRRSLLATTWLETRACWDDEVALPMGKLISVSWVKYLDAAGVLQTLASDQYLVDVATEPGRVVPAYCVTWPTLRDQYNAVTVQYVTGYGTAAAAVPAPIRHWIKLALTFLYENRSYTTTSGAVTEFKFADALLDPYKIWGA
jgi:uncharacterized phiE125 gp8 family phage protein